MAPGLVKGCVCVSVCLSIYPRASVGIYRPCVVVPSVPVRVYLSFVRMVAASRAPDIGIVHSDDDLRDHSCCGDALPAARRHC